MIQTRNKVFSRYSNWGCKFDLYLLFRIISNTVMSKFNMTGVTRKTKNGSMEAKEFFKNNKLCAAVVAKLQ